MAHKSILSIVIATFNSERLLPRVLDSIAKQTYPSSKIEILTIDGGSTDGTREIARSYGCRVIDNPKTLPAWAKYIGYTHARSAYLMYLDSDEIIESTQSIKRKINILQSNPSVHAVTGSGYKSPKSYSILNDYINEYGDPFSFFMYRLSKSYRFFVRSMKTTYSIVEENKDHIIFDFSHCRELPIFELAAMGSIVDLQYLRTNFPNILKSPGLIWHFFHLLVSKGTYIAITKNDALVHYSVNSLRHYLRKITSRVITNVYTPAKEGFKGRDELAAGYGYIKRYLFFPYTFSIILPLIDSIYLSLTRHNFGYLVHVPLCIYTASLIMYYSVLKLFGSQPIFRSYGGAQPL